MKEGEERYVMGQLVSHEAMCLAIKKAKETGVGIVSTGEAGSPVILCRTAY